MRVKREDRRTERLTVRMTPAEADAAYQAAQRAGQPLSVLLRVGLLRITRVLVPPANQGPLRDYPVPPAG